MYICAHCGSIQKTDSDVVRDPQTLDTGTTFTCMQCGKDTVVVLLGPEDYRINGELLAVLKAYVLADFAAQREKAGIGGDVEARAIVAISKAEAEAKATICQWHLFDEEMNAWQGTCGESVFVFMNGSPVENGFRYCPYCGKSLILAL